MHKLQQKRILKDLKPIFAAFSPKELLAARKPVVVAMPPVPQRVWKAYNKPMPFPLQVSAVRDLVVRRRKVVKQARPFPPVVRKNL